MPYQKTTKGGKPVIERSTGLPVYNRSVDYRLRSIREILTIGMAPNDARWANIQASVKTYC